MSSKRNIFYISILILNVVCFAHADLYIQWQSSAPLAEPTATNYPLDASYAQLLWSQDNTPYTPSNSLVDVSDPVGTLYGSNDYLLESVVIPGGGYGMFDAGSAFYSNSMVGGNNINVGYIYSIIFASTNPGLGGTWYYLSGLSNTAPYVYIADPPSSQVTFDSTIEDYVAPTFTALYEFKVVPEPSSFFLFSLGAVSLAAFRRRRK